MRRIVLLSALVAATAACGGGDPAVTSGAEQGPDTTAADPARGGTLRVGLPGGTCCELDPQKDWPGFTWEFHRCCLLRTLMSYNGLTTEEGGAELRPDLAIEPPTVSADGLTWTFRLKPGLRYAPPYEDTEIVAADVIRALERTADPDVDAGSPYYSTIEGFTAVATGEAEAITGLEAPDDHTLVVHLTEPTAELGILFAVPWTAPIPPRAADGHEGGYGRFLVASGPYMLEGSEGLDFSIPTDQQEPVSGYVPGKSITLVRNPSWDPASDDLRKAYPDRIEITIRLGGNDFSILAEQLAPLVDAGELDLVLWEAPRDQVERYRADPILAGRVFIEPLDTARMLVMNVASAPFDDVHVRKAMNLVLDKAAIARSLGAPLLGSPATHIVPDALENNLLLDYAPYATPGHQGDLQAAKKEMAQSRYDTNGDGLCDHASCESVRFQFGFRYGLAEAELVERGARELGIALETVEAEPVPESKIALQLFFGWGRDIPSASNFFVPLFTAPGDGPNTSLVGATPEQLREWGYDVTSVPSVDAKVAECLGRIGGAQFTCWAELDQLLMEEIVPWVPLLHTTAPMVVSERVAQFAWDQSMVAPSLDRIAIEEGSP